MVVDAQFVTWKKTSTLAVDTVAFTFLLWNIAFDISTCLSTHLIGDKIDAVKKKIVDGHGVALTDQMSEALEAYKKDEKPEFVKLPKLKPPRALAPKRDATTKEEETTEVASSAATAASPPQVTATASTTASAAEAAASTTASAAEVTADQPPPQLAKRSLAEKLLSAKRRRGEDA